MLQLLKFVGYSSKRQKELQEELQGEIKTGIVKAANRMYVAFHKLKRNMLTQLGFCL